MWNPWSEKEVKLLKKLYPTASQEELSKRFGRSYSAIKTKAFRMGLRRIRKHPEWSPYEIKVIKKMAATKSVSQISKALGRSHGLVSMKISEMGLKTPKPNYWSNEEIKLIKKLYPTKTAAEIASRLGRSVLVVRGKVLTRSQEVQDSSLVSVPEPATLFLLSLGAVMVRRKR